MMLAQAVQRAAQVNGDGIATVFLDRRRTWREFRDRVARLAKAFETLGVRKGDRIAILGLNSDRYQEALYATWWAGAVAAPMNTRWTTAEALWSLEDSRARILISDDAFAAIAGEVRSKLGSLVLFVHMGEAPEPSGFLNFEHLIAAAEPAPMTRRDPAAMACLLYTGGTTGRPKGVMTSEMGLWSIAISDAQDLNLSEGMHCLHAAPSFHGAGMLMSLCTTIVAGGHVMIPAFRPEAVVQIIEQERVTTTLLVPTMIRMLLDDPATADADLSSLEMLIYGASPMPERTLREAMRVFPHVAFVQLYGQTETGIATVLHDKHHRGDSPRLSAAGRAISCVEVKIADEHGVELLRGEIGEIWARGPTVMMGYWNSPEATAATLVDGWVRTGDAGYMDEQGFVYICDRLKDMIITGGENVFSVEVEGALLAHPDVAEAAVIGVPDDTYGERVHAIVVPKPGRTIDVDALQAHCRKLIAGYKVPRSFEIRETPLPLSGAGKVLKAELRAPYWEGHGKGVN
jgi:acyl-CoA synthetase (AMP-forming)/AMP-acid ligase II